MSTLDSRNLRRVRSYLLKMNSASTATASSTMNAAIEKENVEKIPIKRRRKDIATSTPSLSQPSITPPQPCNDDNMAATSCSSMSNVGEELISDKFRRQAFLANDLKSFLLGVDRNVFDPISLLIEPSLLRLKYASSSSSSSSTPSSSLESKLKEYQLQLHIRLHFAEEDPLPSSNFNTLIELLESTSFLLDCQEGESFHSFLDDVLCLSYGSNLRLTFYKIYKHFEFRPSPSLSSISMKSKQSLQSLESRRKAARLEALKRFRQIPSPSPTPASSSSSASLAYCAPASPSTRRVISSTSSSYSSPSSLSSSPLRLPSVLSTMQNCNKPLQPRQLNHFNQGLQNLSGLLRSQPITLKKRPVSTTTPTTVKKSVFEK